MQSVDCTGLQSLPAPTATTVGLYPPDGRRQLFHAPGAGALAEFALPPGFNHLHGANPFALPFLRHLAPILLRNAKSAGLTTPLNLGWDRLAEWRSVVDPCLPFVDLLFANAVEAGFVPGPYPCPTVIKQGAAGCLVDGALVPGFSCRPSTRPALQPISAELFSPPALAAPSPLPPLVGPAPSSHSA